MLVERGDRKKMVGEMLNTKDESWILEIEWRGKEKGIISLSEKTINVQAQLPPPKYALTLNAPPIWKLFRRKASSSIIGAGIPSENFLSLISCVEVFTRKIS